MDFRNGLTGVPKIIGNVKYYRNLIKLCQSGSESELEIIKNYNIDIMCDSENIK